MPAKRKESAKDSSSSAIIGFEAKLWLVADIPGFCKSPPPPPKSPPTAIHTRYLAGIEHLHDFMQREAMK